MMDDIKLKVCPFCGGKGKMKINPSTLSCSVICQNCDVIMKRNFKGNKKLEEILAALMAEAWNQRATDVMRED